jgi:hypothetical protein
VTGLIRMLAACSLLTLLRVSHPYSHLLLLDV